MIQTNITTVKGTFIICKRVKKVPFYHRGVNYSKTSTTARHAERFADKTLADARCKEINDKRKGKGYKFRVEAAEKHFVSNFRLQFNSYNHQVTVSNELKSIQHITQYKHKVMHSINGDKVGIAASMALQLEREKSEIAKALEQYNHTVKVHNEQMVKLNAMIDYLNNTDLDKEFVEPNLTQSDRTVSVLYGSKNVNT